MDQAREMLRHTLAALAYRATRAIENAPAEFAHYTGGTREPVKILAHMGDLFDWALSMAKGPALIAATTAATGSQRLGASPVILLFLIGLGLLYWAKPDNEQPGTQPR